ncbi:MAG: hypothetical protein IAF94_05715 [Pirellulaceae bacterium]|nr:hypothetical protein [Pirellulaceae bacterium]
MRALLISLVGLALLVPIHGARAGDEIGAAVARKAVEEYLAKIEEIDRVAAQRKAEAKAQLAKALQSDLVTKPSGARYRGMLGSYFNQEGRIPFVMLSVPNGQNVFGDHARSVFNGKYDFTRPLYRFHTRGHVVVPKAGQYFLEAGRGYGDFKLNGIGYSLGETAPGNRVGAEVALQKGEYEVEISTTNNGGQLPETSTRVVDQQTKEELPLFFYESELKAFRGELGERVEFSETSKWTAEEQLLK